MTQQVKDIFELEDDICKASHMASIAVTLLERALGNRKAQQELTGRPDTYYINNESVEEMVYAAMEVQNMTRELRHRYLRALSNGR